jgi:thioredoxin 1
MSVVNVTSEDFQSEVLDHEGETVFVDFWATWCGPCRMVAPVYQALSEQVADAKFVKVDIEENQELAMRFNVKSIPMFLAFRNGEIVDSMVGSKNVDSFVDDNL